MKILYGICGIGRGHLYRQLPQLTKDLDQGNLVVVFGYDQSYNYLKGWENKYPNLKLFEVGVPYIPGNSVGLDWEQSLNHSYNQQNFFLKNGYALKETKKILGKADQVITDYEPIAAQYAYMLDIPLTTFDQQSKFLVGDFPESINGTTYYDEIERLNLFFPKAEKRIIASFFDFPLKKGIKENIEIIKPPMTKRTIDIKEKIDSLKTAITDDILVYLSPQTADMTIFNEIINFCQRGISLGHNFYFFLDEKFLKKTDQYKKEKKFHFYQIGDQLYDAVLQRCKGLVTTAGHGLLSEAVFLNKAIKAFPLPLYEQQINAMNIQNVLCF